MFDSADSLLRKHQLAFKVWDTGLSMQAFPFKRELQAQWDSADANTDVVANVLTTIQQELD